MTDLKELLVELTSGDEPRAEAAAVQFASTGNKGFYALAAMTASENPDHRWWALRALTEFDEPRVSNLLRLALKDPDPGVQACAALGLRLHPNQAAIPDLLGLLGNEDKLLSRLGRDALVRLGSTATPHLIPLLEDDTTPHTVKLEAVRALAEIEDPASISTLFKLSQSGSGLLTHWAEVGLERMGVGMVFFDPK